MVLLAPIVGDVFGKYSDLPHTCHIGKVVGIMELFSGVIGHALTLGKSKLISKEGNCKKSTYFCVHLQLLSLSLYVCVFPSLLFEFVIVHLYSLYKLVLHESIFFPLVPLHQHNREFKLSCAKHNYRWIYHFLFCLEFVRINSMKMFIVISPLAG